MLSSILGFYPLDARSTFHVATPQNVYRHCCVSPREQGFSQLRTLAYKIVSDAITYFSKSRP